MATLLEKTTALLTAYGGNQETLNYILRLIGTRIKTEVLQETHPIPPLKRRERFGKTELVLDEQDKNYLLKVSRYQKRQSIARLMQANDPNTQDNAYRLMIANHDVDIANTEADLYSYIQAISDDLAGVTADEKNAVIPSDETL